MNRQNMRVLPRKQGSCVLPNRKGRYSICTSNNNKNVSKNNNSICNI